MEKDRFIIFKNGEKLTVSMKIANIIRDRIIEGCKNYQCFSSEETGDVECIINLNEVAFIY